MHLSVTWLGWFRVMLFYCVFLWKDVSNHSQDVLWERSLWVASIVEQRGLWVRAQCQYCGLVIRLV